MSITEFAERWIISGSVNTDSRPRAFASIVWGGLTIGIFDIVEISFLVWLVRDTPPNRVFQSVASGLLGDASFRGGWRTAALGLALHFLIAFIWASIFYLASLRLPVLYQWAVPSGMVFGLFIYFTMNYVVIPLSAIGRFPRFNLLFFLNGIIGHALLIGLPLALLVRRSAKIEKQRIHSAL